MPKHIAIALKFVGEQEVKRNSSPVIDSMLASVNLRPGNPYCAAGVSFCLTKAGATMPKVRSGLARNFVTKQSIPASKVLLGIVKIEQGTILIWRDGNTIHGHTGFVLAWEKDKGTTWEANTSSGIRGSQRDGEGIYIRRRTIVPGAAFRITDFTPVSYE